MLVVSCAQQLRPCLPPQALSPSIHIHSSYIGTLISQQIVISAQVAHLDRHEPSSSRINEPPA